MASLLLLSQPHAAALECGAQPGARRRLAAVAAYSCTNPANPFRCSDGSCVVDPFGSPSCPSLCAGCGTACAASGSTYVKCADSGVSGACSTRPDACTLTTCAAGEVSCAAGSCVSSLDACPAVPSCPTHAPVRCNDGSCRGTSTSCVSSFSCAHGLERCADGRCTADGCGPYDGCAGATPLLCSDGACYELGTDCAFGCPAGQVRCVDHSCAATCDEPVWSKKTVAFERKVLTASAANLTVALEGQRDEMGALAKVRAGG